MIPTPSTLLNDALPKTYGCRARLAPPPLPGTPLECLSPRYQSYEDSATPENAYVVAPGEAIGGGESASDSRQVEGWIVSFPLEALGFQAPCAVLS